MSFPLGYSFLNYLLYFYLVYIIHFLKSNIKTIPPFLTNQLKICKKNDTKIAKIFYRWPGINLLLRDAVEGAAAADRAWTFRGYSA